MKLPHLLLISCVPNHIIPLAYLSVVQFSAVHLTFDIWFHSSFLFLTCSATWCVRKECNIHLLSHDLCSLCYKLVSG